ncbi:MAG TPA: hypothetical protein VE913_13245 [Longimicrobium sp.]|nr:hypothetical protein [Longimicrobium sp.]
MDWSYNGFRLCAGIAAFTGDVETMLWCGNIALSMDRIDGTWNALSAPGQERTDGIVQGSSQVYPNAIRQYPIEKGDSHLGETKSDKVHRRVREALDVYFNVPRRN